MIFIHFQCCCVVWLAYWSVLTNCDPNDCSALHPIGAEIREWRVLSRGIASRSCPRVPRTGCQVCRVAYTSRVAAQAVTRSLEGINRFFKGFDFIEPSCLKTARPDN